MNEKEQEYILTMAREKSISKAAEKLFITQPALSLFLSRLEEQLQIRLFERTSKGLVLTDAGECYVAYAKQSQALNRSLDQELCEYRSDRKGRVHIGTSPHIGSIILPEILSDFQRQYPNIEVQITEGTSKILEQMVNQNEVDMALMHYPMKDCQGNFIPVFNDRYVMVFSAENNLAQRIYWKDGYEKPFIDPTYARGQKFVLAYPHQRVRQIADKILSKAEIVPDIRLVTSSVQTALQMSGYDLGISFMPESYIPLFRIQKETVFCYLEDEYRAYWTFGLVYPLNNMLSTPLRFFAEQTKKRFGNI